MPLRRPKCTPPGVLANSGLPCKKIILPSTNDASPVPAMWPNSALRALPMWLGMLSLVKGMYLAPESGPTGFAEIQRHPRPNNIPFPLHRAVHVRPQPLVIPNRHLGLELRDGKPWTKAMVLPKGRPGALRQKPVQHALLGTPGIGHGLPQPLHGPTGHRQTQFRLPSHGTKIASKATRHRPNGQCLVQKFSVCGLLHRQLFRAAESVGNKRVGVHPAAPS